MSHPSLVTQEQYVSILNRLVRMETRLVKVCLHLGVPIDVDRAPPTPVPVRRALDVRTDGRELV